MLNTFVCLALLRLVLDSACLQVAAESTDLNPNQSFSEEKLDNRAGEVTFAVFSLLVATCLSLVAAGITYYSYLEDTLLRRFQREGILVEAQVNIEINFTRHVLQNRAQGDTEYSVYVQYRSIDVDGYSSLIRKKVRAREKDFYQSSKQSNQAIAVAAPTPAPAWENDKSNRVVQLQVEVSDLQFLNNTYFQEAQGAMGSTIRFLELLVLRDSPSAAVPKLQIERDLNKTTIGLTIFLATLTLFCIYVGLSKLQLMLSITIGETSSGRCWKRLSILSISMSITLFLISLFVIHGCCGGILRSFLQNEYLDDVEATIKLDDETLASMSTDTSKISMGFLERKVSSLSSFYT